MSDLSPIGISAASAALPDFRAQQTAVDLWSLRQARAGLAEARAKRLPIATAHGRRDVVSLYLRIRRNRSRL